MAIGDSEIQFFEQLEPLVLQWQKEYRNFCFPPVHGKYRDAYREKKLPELQAAEKAIDDLILKRATEIRKERKASKE